MKSFFTALAVLILSFALFACGEDGGNDDTNTTTTSAANVADNDADDAADNDDAIAGDAIDFSGLGWPIDALINERGELVVLYSSDPFTEDERAAVIWFDDTLKPIRQINAELRFPHTLDSNGRELLISDSQNERLVFIDEQTFEADVVDFDDWELPNVWPNDADFTDDGNIIFSDLYNGTVIKMTRQGDLIWARDVVGAVDGENVPVGELHDPDELPGGHLIFCLSATGRVVEVDADDNEVWSYGDNLVWPKSAQRLGNGNTLITDLFHIIEVNRAGEIVWEYVIPMDGGMNAMRLADGTTLN
ncbi:hypothetical protein KDL45_06540, partial [bacterium]|nr:hypothetical protein [bacterium]